MVETIQISKVLRDRPSNFLRIDLGTIPFDQFLSFLDILSNRLFFESVISHILKYVLVSYLFGKNMFACQQSPTNVIWLVLDRQCYDYSINI